EADEKTGVPELVARVCSTCHGARGVSISPMFPHLAGQPPQYLEAQLKAFRDHHGPTILPRRSCGGWRPGSPTNESSRSRSTTQLNLRGSARRPNDQALPRVRGSSRRASKHSRSLRVRPVTERKPLGTGRFRG